MWPKPTWPGTCVADAFAHGQSCGIGGATIFPNSNQRWFSLQLSHDDFSAPQIPMHDDLQKDISSLKTLAQIALVYIMIQHLPRCRIPIQLTTLSDNAAAESVSNKLFSTQMPLALFLEKLSILISTSSIDVDVHHIAGKSNDLADVLSRWDQTNDPPLGCLQSDRFHLSLSDIWSIKRSARLCPADAWIPWSIP